MNFQTEKDDLQGYSKEEAAKKLECSETALEYYAWPQVFGSTAGPFGGIGGQAMTTFTVEAWAFGPVAIVFCKGKPIKQVKKFTPFNVRF